MALGPRHGEPAPSDLEARLEAERVATAHWRRLAEQRSKDLADLRRRPLVRAVLGIERRLAPARRPAIAASRRLRGVVDRGHLRIMALAERPGPDQRSLREALAARPRPLPISRSTTLIVVGEAPAGPLDCGDRAVHVTAVAGGDDPVGAVRRAIESTESELVGIALATSEPIDDAWAARLADAVRDDVVAAVPVVLHPTGKPRRTLRSGRVRSAGFTIELDAAGSPVVESHGAGAVPDPSRAASDVMAGSAAGIFFDRAAYERAGGLPRADGLDVAVIELCGQLRADGGRVVVVPAAMLVDHRAVRSRSELRRPIHPASEPWRRAVERSGSTLARPPGAGTDRGLRIAITTAVPVRKVAERWGDWHLAEGLATALRRRGHDVRLQILPEADDLASRACDVHVVLRGLGPVRRTEGQRHVLWIVSHPETIDDAELDAADLLLVASERFAQHLRTRTTTPVEVFLQATDHRRFQPRPVDPEHHHPVTVVAKSRDILRPAVADTLAAGIRPSIYGGGWEGLVDPALVVGDRVANDVLPVVYSSADVVLNDHWETMRAWGFASNRLYDVLACGTPIISDRVPGVRELFDGAVVEYDTIDQLRAAVAEVSDDPASARAQAARGRQRVLAEHTFDHRAERLLELLDELKGSA